MEIFRREGSGPGPAVLVIHEVYGLNDDIRGIARRFAREGFLAAAPDLLAGGLRLRCIAQAMRALRSGSGPMVAELESLIEELEARADVTRVGAVGFCMGGGFALLLGTRQRVGAAGVFYGEIRPREELERSCPLVGGYGGRDRMFAGKGRELIATLDSLGREHDVRMYEDAGHSYMNRGGHPVLATLARPLLRVAYEPEAAEDSWRRMVPFLRRHLAPAP